MQIVDSLNGGGAEITILEIIPGLARRGVKTSIVSLLPDDGSLNERVDSLGVTLIRLGRRDPIGLPVELRGVIRRESPDLVNTTLLFSNLAGRVAARTLHVPVITTLPNQDYGPEHRSNSLYGTLGVRAVQAADFVTVPLTAHFHAVSAEVAQVMSRRLRIPRNRLQVVYPGRDPARLGTWSSERRLRMRAALSIDAEAPVILSVGRLDRQKNVEATIAAFRQVITILPNAVLLVAGRQGNAWTAIQTEASHTPGVRLLGHRTDVPDLMCAADVLSFPSRWEGLGIALVEAMALRLGIVASDIPVVAEALGDTGWPLVDPGDPEALAASLISVLRSNVPNDRRKDVGERRFRALFSVEATSGEMAQLYEHVLLASGRRP